MSPTVHFDQLAMFYFIVNVQYLILHEAFCGLFVQVEMCAEKMACLSCLKGTVFSEKNKSFTIVRRKIAKYDRNDALAGSRDYNPFSS